MPDLAGKTALVTGGSRGVGRAIAAALVDQGMNVANMARSLPGVQEAAAELGPNVLALAGNVGHAVEVQLAVQATVERFGRLDLLVNNAGVAGRGPVEVVSEETWRETLETNLVGPFLCAQAAIPHLRAAGGGWIIGIASGAAKQGYPGLSAYCASKFGLIGLNESLAQEVGADGIKVSTVVIGSVLTDFGGATRQQKITHRRPDQKYLEPEDVAEAVVYLLSQSDRAWTQELNLWPA